MARIRSVHPDICESETLAEMNDADAERTFVRLWTVCDDEGRAKADARLLKAKLYPLHDSVTVDDIERDLHLLAKYGSIILYRVDDVRYLEVPSWHDFQKPQHPTASKLPSPPEPSATSQDDSRSPHEDDSTAHEAYALRGSGVETGVGDGVGEGEGGDSPAQAPALSRRKRKASDSAQMSIPDRLTISPANEAWGRKHGFTFDDLHREAPKMLDWHRGHDKPSADWDASLRTWMSRDKRYMDDVSEVDARAAPRETCGNCDSGLILDDDGNASPCPTCNGRVA